MIDRTASLHRTYWYVLDARQNVLGLVDGRLLRDANPFRYASYQYDQESGLYYLKSRYYIPVMGRFLIRDRILSDNLYVYCRNNPINFRDPSGYRLEWVEKGYEFMEEIFGQYPGFVRNTKAFITDFGRRIPDFTNRMVIGEIKNVKYQYLSRQIKGFVQIANEGGQRFVSIVKAGTTLSGTLIAFLKETKGIVIEVSASGAKRILTPFFVPKKLLEDLIKIIESLSDPSGIVI